MTTTSLGIDPEDPVGGVETEVDRQRMHGELVHEFSRRQGIGAAATIGVTLVVSAVLWRHLSVDILLGWTIAQIILATANWMRWRPFTDRAVLDRKTPPTNIEAIVWRFTSGLLWGALAFVVYITLPAPFETFVFLVIAGMAAGGTATLSALRPAGTAYVLGVLLPNTAAFASLGTTTDLALASVSLLYMVAMIGAVGINNKAIRAVITERFRNAKMRRDFQSERDTWLEISNTTEAFSMFDKDDRLLAWNTQYADLMRIPATLLKRGTARTELIKAGRQPRSVETGERKIDDWITQNTRLAADWNVDEYEGDVWIRRRVTITRGGQSAVSFVDVSELKRAEQARIESEGRFRAIVENLPGGIVLKDRDMRIRLAVGPVYDQVHGLTGDERVGKSIFDLVDPENAAQVDRLDRHVLATGEMTEGLQRFPGADGTELELWNIRFPIKDEHGDISGVGCLTQDVTEQRRVESQLQQSQKMEMVGQLTGGIAHDFNNLLTVVFGNASLLADHVADDPVAGTLLRNLLRAAERGGDLTQRLLAFSRRQNLQPVVVDVRETIADVFALLERTIEARVTLDLKVAADLPPVLIDPVQLESALVNLALNSRDAMPDGGTITFEASETVIREGQGAGDTPLPPGRYVELSVRDNGLGISSENTAHIFEPFFTTKETGKGTGLGLSMVYGFARQSGGDVTVSSVEWGGTTITLYLPVAVPDDAIEDDLSRTEEMSNRGGDERIFVIEDDEDVLAFLEASLESKGYTVVTARHGVAAFNQLNAGLEFDLLLSDVVLPRGVTGPEVARHVRGSHPDMPVLFMSGYTGDALAGSGWPEIGYDLIQKPFTRETLFARVRESLDRAGATRKLEAETDD
ncbi:MAG: ATP-binding protein [Alphaproteobacteria bacterium]